LREEQLVVDAHCHLGKTSTREWTAEDLIQMMDKYSIDRAIVFPTTNFEGTSFSKSNDLVAHAVERYPDRLIGFARVNPHRREEAVKELVRSHEELGLQGLKLHPTMEIFPANSRIIHPIMRTVTELGIPVVFHSGTAPYALPSQIADIAVRFPRIPVIMAHMGQSLVIDALSSAKRSRNIILETSGGSSRVGLLEQAVRILGAERIIFGSDWPCCHPAPERVKIEVLDIPKGDKDLILGKNILRILSEGT